MERVPADKLPEVVAADAAALDLAANYLRVFAHRPAAYAAWKQLVGAIKETMDERRYELATLAAARRLRSSYCSLAHGKVLAERFYSPPEVAAIARGETGALDEVDVAVMDLAGKIAGDAGSVTEADVERLRELGLSDDEIVDVALAAAARSFFTKTLDGLGVQPDSTYLDLDPVLRDALTVGRPIATR
ncbi:MAG TPA: hypothetical protein VJT84_04290 [Gaiellaceae bacterium]|nr:hypothetical protein [Gaiellaceae bacterium]